MSLLPDEYNYDYFVYSASDNIRDIEYIWEMRYSEVVKINMLKKFKSYAEELLSE